MPLAEVAQRLAAFEEDSELTEAIKGFFRILEPYVETHEVLMVAGLHGNRPFGVVFCRFRSIAGHVSSSF